MKEGGRKKKGVKDKIKEKLPGQNCNSDQPGHEGEKKEGLVDKIKDKLPGHHNKAQGKEIKGFFLSGRLFLCLS